MGMAMMLAFIRFHLLTCHDSGVIAEKSSTDLFVTDTAGSKDIQRSYSRSNKPLKADEILAQRSAVPAVGTHKRLTDSRITDGLVEPSRKRHKGENVSAKEYERLRKFAYGGDAVKKDVVKQGGDAEYDPWAAEAPVQAPEYSFLVQKKPTREPGTLKRAPISMAKSGKPISAVSKPEGGKSYNPIYEDWEALIQREGDKAVGEEKQRLAEEQQDQERQALIAKAQAEGDRDEWESEWESEWEGILSEREEAEKDKEWLRKKRPERKTPAERNKIKRRKEERRRKMHEEKMRTREQDFLRIKALAKEADSKGRAISQHEQTVFSEDSSDSEGEEMELRRGRLGKAAVPEAPLEVVLADELQDSLRRLKPEGNLLKDRFRRMILRGRIESRAKITQPKQPKREVMEKWGYKDWKLK
jgi:nucleolar protein 53